MGGMEVPNVGKSSLLKVLTVVNPKIAGYPFTTLESNLGVLRWDSGQYAVISEQVGKKIGKKVLMVSAGMQEGLGML